MAKTISMQVAIKNIIGYVSNMSLLLSDEEATALKKEQSGKAVALINNCKIDPTTAHGDGEEALTLLTDPGCPWSKEEKAPIVSAIRTKVEGIRQKSSDQQDINNVEDWYPEWIWDLAKSHCNVDNVFEHIAGYSVGTLKLRNPSEFARRDIVALVFAVREITPTSTDAMDHIEKIRRHFDAARTLHQGAKGPAVYPSDPAVFARAERLSSQDCPVPSKASKHALTATKLAVKCRKPKTSTVSVEPSVRAKGKQGQASLKEEDAMETLAGYVMGKIKTDDVMQLPGVARLLKGEQASTASAATGVKSEPSGAATYEPLSPSVAAPSTETPSASVPASSVGDLEKLREMTRLKFEKLGMELDDEGRAIGNVGGKTSGKRRKTSVKKRPAALKRPAAACSASDEDEDESVESEGDASPAPASKRPLKRPASSQKQSLPKGWSFEMKVCQGGERSYPVWTSPSGKRVRSWTGVRKMLGKK